MHDAKVYLNYVVEACLEARACVRSVRTDLVLAAVSLSFDHNLPQISLERDLNSSLKAGCMS